MNIFFEVKEPIVDFSCFSSQSRNDGISGFMRLRNEAEFLAQSIESWLPLLDELIIIYNNCQDNTGEIAYEYATKYPDKIKVYHYIPIVYPQGSDNYFKLNENDYHSLVNYYNFALAQTTKKWAIKIDGDLIIPNSDKIKQLKEQYHNLKENEPNAFIPVSGINIIDHLGHLYVADNATKFCGLHGDLSLFKVDEDTIFKKGANCEYLDLSHRKKKQNIFAYYHLKFMKNDYGLGNYDFQNNSNSNYYMKTQIFLMMLKFLPLKDVLAETNMPLVNLNDFGLNRNRDYRKDALEYLQSQAGQFSLKIFIKELLLYIYINNRLINFSKKVLKRLIK